MQIPLSHVMETERCRLRIVSKDDIPHVFSASRHSGFNAGMHWDPPASETELVQPYENNLAAWENDTAYCFTIEEKQTSQFIGRIAIRREEESGVWSLGFWTHPEHQGRGYMSEVTLPVVAFGFDVLSADRIEACHAVWNKASERVLRKLGMRFVRHLPEGFKKDGRWVKENLLAIAKIEWKKRGIEQAHAPGALERAGDA